MPRHLSLAQTAALTALLLVAGLAAHVHGAPEGKAADRLQFDVVVTAADPFHPSNASTGSATPIKVSRGETLRIQITGTLQPGFHSYPLTVPPGRSQDSLSFMTIGPVKGIVPVGPVVESPPVEVLDKVANRPVLQYEKPFTWTQEIRIAEDARPGRVELPVKIDTSACDENKCFPIHANLKAVFEVTGPAGTDIAVKPDPEANPQRTTAPSTTPNKQDATAGLIADSADDYERRLTELGKQIVKAQPAAGAGRANAATEADTGLFAFILAGIFWGAISLITPCVFPMIPITVSFFLKQSEKEHHRPITMASVYSLTIVVVLTLAAAFMLSVFRWLSINPIMNYLLGGIFVFFALSLFGMYEIELPSGLARFTSAREGRGGLIGTMFMALTFTIISFACVAPFLGGFGGTAAAARPLWHNLLGGLAFSVTFAAPFFVLALFPSLLKALPKSGSWLNSVKVVMGFLELAAAFKFFRGAELLQSAGAVTFFSYDLVLGVWIALAFLCGLYLLGVYRLPHDTPAESIGVPRLLFSAAFIGLGLYLAPALFKSGSEGASQRPGGAVYAWVDAFLLPESRRSVHTGDLYYAVEQAREHMRKTGTAKRIFVDFTGVVCSNCRYNEQNVFPIPEVQRAMQDYIGVELYTDKVPLDLFAPKLTAELATLANTVAYARANAEFELKVFDQEALPFYAILEPQADGRILIVDEYNEGRIMNVPEFTRFVTGARAQEKVQLAAANP
jgi:thiol:disulfide interchange protein